MILILQELREEVARVKEIAPLYEPNYEKMCQLENMIVNIWYERYLKYKSEEKQSLTILIAKHMEQNPDKYHQVLQRFQQEKINDLKSCPNMKHDLDCDTEQEVYLELENMFLEYEIMIHEIMYPTNTQLVKNLKRMKCYKTWENDINIYLMKVCYLKYRY